MPETPAGEAPGAAVSRWYIGGYRYPATPAIRAMYGGYSGLMGAPIRQSFGYKNITVL